MKTISIYGLILFCLLPIFGFKGSKTTASYIKIYNRSINKKYAEGYHLDINYPEIKGNIGNSSYSVNKKIQKFASRTVKTFTDLSSEFKPASADTYNYLNIDYKVLFSSSRFVSIQFDKSMKLIGSDNPFQETKTLNYNLSDESIIRLSDILESKSQKKLASLLQKYNGVEIDPSEISNSTQFGLENKFLVLKLKKEGDNEPHLYKLPWYSVKDILLKNGIGYELYEMNSRF